MTNIRSAYRWPVIALAIAILATPLLRAADTTADSEAPTDSGSGPEASQAERFQKFESMLNGVKFVGQFTVIGQGNKDPREEEYTIKSVKKLPRGDYWLFTARIKYGSRDVVLPLPLEVKWAGDTPIITLTELPIPILGTFSSRVIVYNNRYAGTWTHGEVGGHLFGVIKKAEDADSLEVEPGTEVRE
jgi:hypothetical protein